MFAGWMNFFEAGLARSLVEDWRTRHLRSGCDVDECLWRMVAEELHLVRQSKLGGLRLGFDADWKCRFESVGVLEEHGRAEEE